MTDWYATLPGLLDAVWQDLTAATGPGTMLRPVLATVDGDGAPRMRIVMLRGADRGAGILQLHTDAATPKVDEIAQNPAVALHLWDETRALQLRLHGTARVVTGAVLDGNWAGLPAGSRDNYGVDPVPGTPIPHAGAFTRTAERDRFARIEITLEDMDIVELSPDHHRRASFTRATGWAGRWLAP